MLEFLIDGIFVSFGGMLFQQVVGMPLGASCAALFILMRVGVSSGACK
jgi:hypothetical protein